jgi:subtilase family serine protease
MTSRHPHQRRSASARALADLRRSLLALLPAVALAVLVVPAHALAAGALARTTDALTGVRSTAGLTSRSVCLPASPSRATCYAQMLVTRGGRAPVHPRLARPVHAMIAAARSASRAHDAGPPAAPQPQPGTPAYMQQAYDLSYLSQVGGVGDTVAIVDSYDAPNAEADLATYRSSFGLPACTTQNGCFRKVNENGGQSFPGQAPGWAAEISLDLDAVSALCPHCHILLVEANSAGSADMAAAQAQAAALGAKQITDSWGDPTPTPLGGTFTFPGIATVAATGDQGFLGLVNSQYPAALPDVTAAGGTNLIPASASGTDSARGFTEQAWAGAGSGCALLSAKPAWQSDSGCAGRTYSDLSADANPQTGLNVYDSGDGGWLVMGGTSESAPLIAAYYAVTAANASTPQWAYQRSSLLNAPAGGSNGSCQASILYLCLAGSGYNGPTGVGSISGAVVPGAPGIGGPGAGNDYTQSATATSAQLQAGIYPNSSDTAYSWQYGASTAYGQTTPSAAAGSGQAPVTVSSTLSGLAANTTYHYRLAATNAYGTIYGYDSTLVTTGSSATAVTSVRVTGAKVKLRGTVTVADGSATYHFSYGTGTGYRHNTSSQNAWGGPSARVSATLSRLSPHTTYHVRLVVQGAGGRTYSAPRTFTTGKGPRAKGRRHQARHGARHH